eukprot:Plantae.Rhodophyta-Purpureofilum_apyrenoidigerum.ctg11393.p1 GENE.Plantae.Rhodophyta-Purpureofilum_apyrenoidigerum.ctg11393~~Plantae.Rhodophyta-Purpureofilum_apyrenoidigerum.ctg11393.p1  ORF type:complete len:213 (+),score=33.95 Plantae.Rhodophyta-Purpureofilum_apyrenoidigerum.ctg11393:128-766(+)
MEALHSMKHRLMEAEFSAEDEMVSVVPTRRMGGLELLTGTYGPFRPGVAEEVPLWVALAMKKLKACKILPPSWMEIKELERIVEDERLNKSELNPIPFYYAEIAALILHYASEDLRAVATIRRGVEDLTTLRSNKLKRSMMEIQDMTLAVRCQNICSIEINNVRPLMTQVLSQLYITGEREVPRSELQSSHSQGRSSSLPTSGGTRLLRRYR